MGSTSSDNWVDLYANGLFFLGSSVQLGFCRSATFRQECFGTFGLRLGTVHLCAGTFMHWTREKNFFLIIFLTNSFVSKKFFPLLKKNFFFKQQVKKKFF